MERFWSKVDKTPGQGPQGECWEWRAGQMERGYGVFWDGQKKVLAHRWAYAQEHGSVDADTEVCHTCDNPACVRPTHLFAGTHIDNMLDMREKGRAVATVWTGETNGRAKLDWPKVRDIRRRWSDGGVTKLQLARDNEVSDTLIRQILRNEIWKEAA